MYVISAILHGRIADIVKFIGGCYCHGEISKCSTPKAQTAERYGGSTFSSDRRLDR
ncbi:hypothetical protein M404DRAFT_996370 [Pisolithus tinctorius Marx 270]|uniref:Uncharacterized protein n=1 Tax=Pisolithus tinctorius Marx 270 TaxID=870435 RepID=A0A0C3PLC0_PISTI|nr:hypothetical protein M404DRAFT_996370 [Pisolithus tinctorius Marx 270]